MILVTTVGGASGPLYGSLLMGIGKGLKAGKDPVEAFAEGVDSVKKRGKSDVGAKTMLDVLVPALDALRAAARRAAPSCARSPPPAARPPSRCWRAAAAPRSWASARSAMSIRAPPPPAC